MVNAPGRFFEDKNEKRIFWWVAFVFIPLSFGLFSLYLGRDVNWDLKNYHYYNAYAFLEERLDFDVAPAQLQTFINPIADLPFYLLVKYYPSWVAGFVFGFFHGFNLSFILLIYWRAAQYVSFWLKLLVGISLVVVSGVAPMFVSELGNVMHDNLTSVFVLGALYILICALEKLGLGEKKIAFFQIGIAGLIMGMGVGIKPSITIFALSSAIVLMCFVVLWSNKLVVFIVYGAAGVIGGGVTAGFWWWELWKRFENPFFPFYNHIFKSPYFTSSPVNWSAFMPDKLWEYIAWPYIFTLDSYRSNQLYFFDVRFALLYTLCIVWLMVFIFKKNYYRKYDFEKGLFNVGGLNIEKGNFILYFFCFSYVLWIMESATYRFMIPLELLVPFCFLVISERLIKYWKTRTFLLFGVIILTFSLYTPFNWTRLDWDDSYFIVDATRFKNGDDAIVLLLGYAPVSYVIPEFPPTYRFFRLEGNFVKSGDSLYISEIKDFLAAYKGDIYILYEKNDQRVNLDQSLVNLGLNSEITDCFLLKTNALDEIQMCLLVTAQ